VRMDTGVHCTYSHLPHPPHTRTYTRNMSPSACACPRPRRPAGRSSACRRRSWRACS
jgi:hypothetical protein